MKFRISFAVLLSAAACLAQSNPQKSDHKRADKKTQAQLLDNAIAATTWDGGIAGHGIAASPETSVTIHHPTETKTLPLDIAWEYTALTTGWTTTGTAVPTGTTWCDGGGGCFVFNDHTTGIETRPLDDNGPTLTQVDYSAVNLDQAKLAPASYIQLAKAIQLESPSTDEAELLKTIYDHHFRVYDFEKVDQYLYRQALKQGTRMRWVWKPMREVDYKQLLALGQVPSANGIVYSKLYAQRLPARILEDSKCVLDDVKDAVFLVSDYEVVRPDPFLAISTPKLLAEGKLWIIDRWDEPGFEDSKKAKPAKEIPARDVVIDLSPGTVARLY